MRRITGQTEPDLRDRLLREMDGVEDFLANLDRHWDKYPHKWREGMYRHYLRRKGEIEAALDALDDSDDAA